MILRVVSSSSASFTCCQFALWIERLDDTNLQRKLKLFGGPPKAPVWGPTIARDTSGRSHFTIMKRDLSSASF